MIYIYIYNIYIQVDIARQAVAFMKMQKNSPKSLIFTVKN